MPLDPSHVRLEWATPEVRGDLERLSSTLQQVALGWLARARRTLEASEPCRDAPGQPLEGCRKVRFDEGDDPLATKNPPRAVEPGWRLLIEYLPGEDDPRRLLVWAVGRGHAEPGERRPDAYTLAGGRRRRRLTEDPSYRREVGRE
jgi:hypothetical protein